MKISQNQSFLSFAKSVFQYDVGSRKRIFSNEDNRIRKQFWKNIYVAREDELSNFNDFIENDDAILFMTGHLGTGKSTFLREKLENGSPKFNGHIIDLRGRLNSLNNGEKPETDQEKFSAAQKKIYEIIREDYKIAIYNNLKNHLANQIEQSFTDKGIGIEETLNIIKELQYEAYIPMELYESTQKYREINYDLDYQFGALINPLKVQPVFNDFIDLIYAVEALYHIRSPKLEEIKIKLEVKSESGLKFRQNIIKALRGNYTQIKEIIDSVEVIDQIAFYNKLFYQDTEEVHLLYLDNFDGIPVKIIKDFIADILIDLVARIHNGNEYQFSHTLGFRPFKAGIAVRDENISRYFIGDALSARTMQISLGKEEFIIPEVSNYVKLDLNYQKCYEIIKSRLTYITNNYKAKSEEDKVLCSTYSKLVEELYLDEDERKLKANIGFINIQDFCNSSIRLVLDHIHSSVDLIIDKLKACNKLSLDFLDANYPYALFKGLFIQSLWKHKYTIQLMQSFQKNLKRELEDDECCMMRMVLVYIVNHEGKVFSVDIINRFKQVFDKSQEQMQKFLLSLTKTELREGELITIYQQEIPDEPAKIDPRNAEIKINPKGVVFIDKILKHIDFYGQVFSSRNSYKALIEQTPGQIIDSYKAILEHLKKLKEQHKLIYEMALQKIVDEYKNYPFKAYSEEFIYKNTFHLCRVCDTHSNYLYTYIENLLSDQIDYLLIDQKDIDAFKAQIPADLKNANITSINDEEREKLFSTPDCPNEIKDIHRYCVELSNIAGELKNIENRLG